MKFTIAVIIPVVVDFGWLPYVRSVRALPRAFTVPLFSLLSSPFSTTISIYFSPLQLHPPLSRAGRSFICSH